MGNGDVDLLFDDCCLATSFEMAVAGPASRYCAKMEARVTTGPHLRFFSDSGELKWHCEYPVTSVLFSGGDPNLLIACAGTHLKRDSRVWVLDCDGNWLYEVTNPMQGFHSGVRFKMLHDRRHFCDGVNISDLRESPPYSE